MSHNKKNISIRRIWSHWCFAQKVWKVVEDTNPNFVYCLVPPNSLVKDLATLKQRKGFKLFYFLHIKPPCVLT